jgi:hypothetical protein
VLIVLGAMQLNASLLGLITGNQIVAGSVNASPEAFAQASQDLGSIPPALAAGLIERRSFNDFRASFAETGQRAPKVVHVID